VASSIRLAEPQEWLPFVNDDALRAWRNWLADQLGPGKQLQTAAVFAERMGRSALEIESVLCSPDQLHERVLRHIPTASLRAFRETAYSHSARLIESYVSGVMNR
jgi:hypothetical protein